MRHRMGKALATQMQIGQWQNSTTGQANDGIVLGTVGIYIGVGDVLNNLRFLTHRRAWNLNDGGSIATPGGSMDRADYDHQTGWAHTEQAFNHAARRAAWRELYEESGIFLSTDQMNNMIPISEPHPEHTTSHTNFFLWIGQTTFDIKGPGMRHAAEIIEGGMDGMGISAGDNHHSWMTTQELLNCTKHTAEYTGLMEACRLPLMTILTMDPQPDDRNLQSHPQLQAQDKPGEGEIRTRALECFNNEEDCEGAAYQLLILIEIGKRSHWPAFNKASFDMEKDWQDDRTNLQSDNTAGYLIYAATGMPPRDYQFLAPDNDNDVDQLDDELSADDRLTGDR